MAAFTVPGGGDFNNNDGTLDIVPGSTSSSKLTKPGNSRKVQPSRKQPVLQQVGKVVAAASSNPQVRRLASNLSDKALDAINNRLEKKSNNNNRNYDNKQNFKSRKGKGKGGSNYVYYGPEAMATTSSGGAYLQRGASASTGTDSIIFSSGISAGLVVNSRIQKEGYSPLFISSGWLFKVTDPDLIKETSKVDDQLYNVVYPLIERIISNVINRFAGIYVQPKDFVEWFHATTEALQIYYTIDNILVYSAHNTSDNVNYGMEYLRNVISAEVTSEWILLKERLEIAICPPNLLSYIRWFCQTYRTSDAPHSPLIRINVGGMYDSNWTIGNNQVIKSLLTKARLDLNKCSRMESYLSRAIPSWVIGKIPESCYLANFDVNFLTFWHNQNCCFKERANDASFSYTYVNKGMDDYLDYQIIERDTDVDGAIFATASSFFKAENLNETIKTVDTVWGIWQPLSITENKNLPAGDQREAFNVKAISETGLPVAAEGEVLLGRSGIHWLVEFTGPTGNLVGSRKQFGSYGFVDLQNVSARMQNEAFNETMRMFMDPPSIQ